MINIINERGETLAGVWHPGAGQPRYVVVICHGFRGGKDGGGRAVQLAEAMSHRGYSAVRFDFSGAGDSSGDFADITLTRQTEDLAAVLDWIDRTRLGIPLLLGRSFGGSTAAIRAAAEPRVRGICLWSTPADLRETFTLALGEAYQELAAGRTVSLEDDYSRFSLHPSFVSDLVKHDVLSAIRALSPRPVLIVHGENDQVVPVKQARAAFAAAGEPKKLLVIPKADHRFLHDYQAAGEATLDWLTGYFPC